MTSMFQIRVMKLSEQIAERMLDGMDVEEKKQLVIKLSDHLVSSLGPDDRKDLVVKLMPVVMERMFEGMDPQEKKALVRSLMPSVMDAFMGPSSRQ